MIVFFGDDVAVAERLSRIRVPVDRIEVRFSADWLHRPASDIALALSDGLPAAIVIGPTTGGIDPIAVIGALEALSPGISVVLCNQLSGRLVLAAMRAGARDVVPPDIGDQELYEAIGRALETSARRREYQLVEAIETELETTIVSVLSPKGGVGRTMLATNIAVGLARKNPGEVVLVDFDVQFGDVANVLGISPTKTLADAANAATEGIDATRLKTFLTAHPSELYVLAGTESLVEAEAIDPRLMKDVISTLAADFNYVVIDTSAAVTDFTLAALEASTDALLLSSTDVPAVRDLRRMLDALDAIGLTEQRRHLIINKSTERYGVPIEHVEDAAALPATVQIPTAKEVAVATNQGVAVVDLQGRNPVQRALQPLIDALSANTMDETAKPTRFWRREAS